jgi:glyoxylase-like metal-dependent hydrolase (beta-lactamase superfamily II)
LYNRSIEDIKHIFLSHPHYDHTGGLAEILQENTGIEVWASESASKLVNEGIPARGLMPSPGLVSAFMNSMIKGMSKDKIAAVESINILKEGKHPVYKEIGVISLPGHTIGHLGFLIEDVDKRVMLAFDALTTFFGPRLMFGYEDLQTGKQSIEKLLEYDFDTLAVGHGKPIEEKVYERLVAKF